MQNSILKSKEVNVQIIKLNNFLLCYILRRSIKHKLHMISVRPEKHSVHCTTQPECIQNLQVALDRKLAIAFKL